jgi:hypothetical protein
LKILLSKISLDFRNISGTKNVILQNCIEARPEHRAGFFHARAPHAMARRFALMEKEIKLAVSTRSKRKPGWAPAWIAQQGRFLR